MKIVKLTDAQRRRIVRAVKPSLEDVYSYQNLNLVSAVYNEKYDFYLTMTYYLSQTISCCNDCDEYGFILLFRIGSVVVHIKNKDCSVSKGILWIPKSAIQDAINYYNDSYTERREIERGTGGTSFTKEYLKGTQK